VSQSGLCETVPVRRLVGIMAVSLATLVGCSPPIGGRPVIGSRDVDQGYFFAGDVALFGQHVSAGDTTLLTYLRALRRIDVCGLLTGDALRKVGETVSVGTLFAFGECDADLKVSGEGRRRLVSVELGMTRTPDGPPASRVGDTPLYSTGFGSCDLLIPLTLDRLPGARALSTSVQPFLKEGLIGLQDCELSTRIAGALATRLASVPLPARDAAATYWTRLAERDPCEVLSVLPDPVARWDVPGSGPYGCRFDVVRAGYTVPLQVRLEPQLVEVATEARSRIDRQGTEIYVDPVFCSAVSFVDAPMQRKVIGSGYVDVADVVIRPAVVVDSDGGGCDVVSDVVTEAARLYG
jgi:hypothetical protein